MFTVFTMTEPRDRILNCACELYLKDGFEGFSMRKLARRVGVTAPALYRHYENREKVLLAVVGQAHNVLARYLYRSLAGETPRERFARAGEAYLDFALDHPRYFQMIYSFAEFMGLDEVPEEVAEETCAVERFWHDRVRECVEAGLLRSHELEEIGLSLWAHAYGLISLYLHGMLDVPEETFRQMYAGSFVRLLRGIATPAYASELEAELEAEEALPDAGPVKPAAK